MLTQTLDEWLEQHHDPAWKFKKPHVKKLGKVRAQRSEEFVNAVEKYEYQITNDYRTIREPVTLDRFIELKHNPKWKPKKLIVRLPELKRLTDTQHRQLAADWAREVARLTKGKVAA